MSVIDGVIASMLNDDEFMAFGLSILKIARDILAEAT